MRRDRRGAWRQLGLCAYGAKAGVGGQGAVLVSAGTRGGNLAWALREMADASRRQAGHRLRALLQMLFPVLLLMLGGLVFLICVAYFSPLVRLIERAAQ